MEEQVKIKPQVRDTVIAWSNPILRTLRTNYKAVSTSLDMKRIYVEL